MAERLEPGRDYTVEDGLFVLTASYLKRRGYCCENGCRNCPYGYLAGDSPRVYDTRLPGTDEEDLKEDI